jgi:hypothetical protein
MAIPFAIPAAVSAFVRSVQGAIIIALTAALIALALYVWGFRVAFIGFDGLADKLEDCRAARATDRRTYEDAQRQAKEANRAEVQRIKSEQEKISHEVQSDLNARLERLRRELRAKGSTAGGASRGPGASPNGKPTERTDGEAGLCLAPEELLRGAENEERHDQLISWVERQLGVKR